MDFLTALTLAHVAISLVGIGSGLVVAHGLLTSRRLRGWTALFLTSTVATSATGFLFPFERFLPSHAVGILSLLVLPVAIYALYKRQLSGLWRSTYVVTAMLALYLNVFVLVVQLFLKMPALQAIAPQQTDPPFIIAQSAVLVLFIVLTALSLARFRPSHSCVRA